VTDQPLSDILILRFPMPDSPISENESRRMHWAQRRRRTEPWKEAAQQQWIINRRRPEAKAMVCVPATVRVWIPFLKRRRRDPHNYVSTVVKPIIDGLTDMHEKVPPGRMVRTFEGIWPDDTPEWVEVREPRIYEGLECVVEIWPRLAADELARDLRELDERAQRTRLMQEAHDATIRGLADDVDEDEPEEPDG
jgi:hypothetical protein